MDLRLLSQFAAAACLCASMAQAQASLPEIVDAAAQADIVLLGEVHDNPAHHDVQASVLNAIGPAALVFEMVSSEDAAQITPEIANDATAMANALNWSESGWPDFDYYAPLFAFAADVPIYGAEIDRAAAQMAFAEGAQAVFPGDGARFGLDRPLDDDEQATREAEQLAAHCDALPEDLLPGFVEAQRLRDAALAEAALAAFEAHGGPVAVITGNGHARRDWGVPALITRAVPDLSVLSLGQFEAMPDGDVPFDLWTLADPVDRPDPCAAFR